MVSINELQARISKHGLTSPNRFVVEFTSPPKLAQLFNREHQERLAIQCETTSLPGKSFSTQENRIWGPIRKLPYTPTFTSTIEMTFRVGTDFRERTLFDVWNGFVMNPDNNMFNYYSEYTTQVIIHQLDREDKRIYSVRLDEVWPEAIGPIDLSSDVTNGYNKQTITFAFRQWKDVTSETFPFIFATTTTVQKGVAGSGIGTFLMRAAGAFYDQLPRITGSGGTLFGSILNRAF